MALLSLLFQLTNAIFISIFLLIVKSIKTLHAMCPRFLLKEIALQIIFVA